MSAYVTNRNAEDEARVKAGDSWYGPQSTLSGSSQAYSDRLAANRSATMPGAPGSPLLGPPMQTPGGTGRGSSNGYTGTTSGSAAGAAATQSAVNRPGATPQERSAAYTAMMQGAPVGGSGPGVSATHNMLSQGNTGAKGGGGVSTLGGAAAAARYNAAQFVALAQSNPEEAQRLADMGVAPEINGVYGGGWVIDRNGGNPAEQAAYAAMARGVPASQAGGPAQTVPTQMTPAFFRAGWRQRPDGSFYNETTGYDPNRPQVGQGSGTGTVALPQQQAQGFSAAPAGGAVRGYTPVRGPAGSVAPTAGLPGAAGGLTGFMSQGGYTTPSVANANPMDETSVIRAQEADRNAALQTLFGLQQGVGGSALAQGIERLGADLANNPESMTDADQRDMEARAIDMARTSEAESSRRMREDLGGTGRLGSGAGIGALRDNRLKYDQGLADDLRDIRLARMDRRGSDRRASLEGATGALSTLGGLAAGTANKISDIFANTERDDAEAARALYQQFFGLGGGYGG